MSKFEISRSAPGRCKIRHMLAESEILTDLPPEFGGMGRSFSSTDLVTAALGSCILTAIDTIMDDWGYDPDTLKILVQKHLGMSPKSIQRIEVEILYTGKAHQLLEQRILEAVTNCPVRRSLNEKIEVEVGISAC